MLTEENFECPSFKPYVVDGVRNVAISVEDGGNELPTLGYLQAGLDDIYQKTKIYEFLFLQKYEKESGKRNLQGWGLDFLNFPGNEARLIPCYFHWFGTSMVNYVRLVGFLDGVASKSFSREDLESEKGCEKVKLYCDEYVRGVKELAAVLVWRNKIAAHFAITDPKSRGKGRDNLALLNLATMFPVGFSDGRFIVGQVGHSRMDKAGVTHSAKLPLWSLTHVYETLRERFFSNPMQGPSYAVLPASQVKDAFTLWAD